MTKTNTLKDAKTFYEKIQSIEKTRVLQNMTKAFIDYMEGNEPSLKKVIAYLLTTKMNGKMEGFQSLSTSNLCNQYCKAYKGIANCICSKCYADSQLKMYKNQALKLELATLVLKELLKVEDLPIINASYFRFEAFGDLSNEIQFINYCNIARINPDAHFTLWTKNPFIIANAIENGCTVPDNMRIIYSEKMIDRTFTENELSELAKKYPFIWKVFAVYSNEKTRTAAVENGYHHCQKSCMNCRYCYRHESKGLSVIAELLK